ncbi:hypothetical protein DB347_12000 [Opitutaceae bacterium EW11]|nr:hypothetical protein DB347_12000 [Opitutaceae bacterium EW11]
MNTKLLGLLLVGSLAAALSPVAKAGPGIDYWRRVSDHRAATPAKADESQPAAKPCTDSKLVNVTETRNAWENGRGPLETKAVGTKWTCTSCGETTTTVRRAWTNGKGPLITHKARTQHDCSSCGGAEKS